MKATQKSEYKIKENMKDPKKVERRVTEMMDKEDYWIALEEAQRALTEDARFDDTHIKEEFDKGRILLAKYQKQLLALDVIALDSSEYTKLLDEKAGLTGNQSLYWITIIIRWVDQTSSCQGRESSQNRRDGQTTKCRSLLTFIEAKEEEFNQLKAQLESMLYVNK